ncbi:MAG: HepT-like ribonuclease domain-containing protein [Acetobacteraceae bacterium]
MPSERRTLALQDIRDNGRLAQDFLGDLTLPAFRADRRTLYAVVRFLEIVSEAARRLPTEIRERHPNLPWRAIMDVGNFYRHDYDNIEAAPSGGRCRSACRLCWKS